MARCILATPDAQSTRLDAQPAYSWQPGSPDVATALAARFRAPRDLQTKEADMKWPYTHIITPLIVGALLMRAPGQPTAVPLVPAIAPAPHARTARGVFFTHSQAVALPGGTLWLASTPDGNGELCSDDQVTVRVQGAQQTVWQWEHVFASADRQAITCVAPQPVLVPSADSYTITITLADLFPDTYSSRPYYLAFRETLEGASAVPGVAKVTQSPVPTHSTPTATLLQPTAAPGLPLQHHAPAEAPAGQRWPGIASVLGSAALATVLVVLRRYRPRKAAPIAQAIIDLFDQETREARTLALAAGTTLIARRPLRVIAESASGDAAAAIGHIRLTADGAELSMPSHTASAPVMLAPTQRYELADGTVVLRYRGPVPSPRRAAAAQKGWTR